MNIKLAFPLYLITLTHLSFASKLHDAVEENKIEIVQSILEKSRISINELGKCERYLGKPPLLVAVQNDNLPLTKLLLKYRANPNLNRYSPKLSILIAAIKNKNLEIVQCLVENGAKTDHIITRTGRGTTNLSPLVHACKINNESIMRYLLLYHPGFSALKEMNYVVDPLRIITNPKSQFRESAAPDNWAPNLKLTEQLLQAGAPISQDLFKGWSVSLKTLKLLVKYGGQLAPSPEQTTNYQRKIHTTYNSLELVDFVLQQFNQDIKNFSIKPLEYAPKTNFDLEETSHCRKCTCLCHVFKANCCPRGCSAAPDYKVIDKPVDRSFVFGHLYYKTYTLEAITPYLDHKTQEDFITLSKKLMTEREPHAFTNLVNSSEIRKDTNKVRNDILPKLNLLNCLYVSQKSHDLKVKFK